MMRKEDLRSAYKDMCVLEKAHASTKEACKGLKEHLDAIKRRIRKFNKSNTRRKEYEWHYSPEGEARWCKEFMELCTPEELEELNQIYDLEHYSNYGQFETSMTRAFNVAGKCVYYIFQRRIS